MVVVGGPRAEQTQDFVMFKQKIRVCAFLVRGGDPPLFGEGGGGPPLLGPKN